MKKVKKMIVLILSVSLLLSGSKTIICAASEKSDGENMEKVLKYYKTKQFEKAIQYSKKLSKTAREACVSDMSAEMKKAYLKIVKKYKADSSDDAEYLWDYYYSDVDNDKKADLLLKYGSCEGDVKLYVYQYKAGKAKKIGSVEAFHTSYYAYPNHKGVIGYGGMMGKEWVRLITIKDGKLKEKTIGTHTTDEDYFNLRCILKSQM